MVEEEGLIEVDLGEAKVEDTQVVLEQMWQSMKEDPQAQLMKISRTKQRELMMDAMETSALTNSLTLPILMKVIVAMYQHFP